MVAPAPPPPLHRPPRISVVIVVRNSVNTLERAITSLLSQQYPALELLILDAGSTDGTLDIIKRHETHIGFWRSHADDGPSDAMNEGVRRATGDIICFLNADDWYEPGILGRVAQAFLDHPGSDIVTCEARMVRIANTGEGYTQSKYFSGKSLEITPAATPMPNARFFRRHVLLNAGPMLTKNADGSYFIANDLEFLMRLCTLPIRNNILPVLGYTYLEHAGSLTFGGDTGRQRQMYEERVFIAGHYLARSDFPQRYRYRLRRWHRRGTARRALRQMRNTQWREAFRTMHLGIKVSGALWCLDFLRIALTRGASA